MPDLQRRIEGAVAAASVAVVAGLFVVGASGIRGDAGRFPQLVGTIVVLLALAEAIVRALSPQFCAVPPRRNASDRWRAMIILGWFTATISGFYLLGVVVSTIVFTTVYYCIIAGWRFLPSLAVAGMMALAFWIVFSLMAGFRLHSGVVPLPWP